MTVNKALMLYYKFLIKIETNTNKLQKSKNTENIILLSDENLELSKKLYKIKKLLNKYFN